MHDVIRHKIKYVILGMFRSFKFSSMGSDPRATKSIGLTFFLPSKNSKVAGQSKGFQNSRLTIASVLNRESNHRLTFISVKKY